MRFRARQRLYQSRRWQKLRLAIFERDGHRCQDCGNPGALECDHIDQADALFWEPSNLRTLCRSCHIERHQRERRLAEFDRRREAWADFAQELAGSGPVGPNPAI